MKSSFLAAGAALLLVLSGGAAQADAFGPCADADDAPELSGSLCAVISAPLDYSGEIEGTVDLFVRQFPAAGVSRGQVWMVAGGPGESGAGFYPFLDTLRLAFPDMDLIAPDHRGTGYSSKLCPDQEGSDSENGIALSGSEWEPCIGALYQNTGRAHAFTITNAARDLSGLIAAYRSRGEAYVYAVSYGTQLVLRMMQVAAPRIDGLMLDGLVPPETAPQWDLSRRTAVVDRVGRELLTTDQAVAYERLLAAVPDQPAWLATVPGGDLKRFMGALLNFPDLRAHVSGIIEELTHGETTILRSTASNLEAAMAGMSQFPQSPPSLPLVMLISGSENNERRDLTAETVAEEAAAALFTSPLPGFLAANPMPLYERDAAFGQPPPRLPRTLVMHGTHDPNTPYEGATAHVEMFRQAGDVHLTTVEGGAHLLAFVAPDCFIRSTRAFVEAEPIPETCSTW